MLAYCKLIVYIILQNYSVEGKVGHDGMFIIFIYIIIYINIPIYHLS